MIRNLKILIAAAMALAALGAIGASGAQAAGEQFHCSVEPCRFTLKPDGTGKTAHHVFIVKNSLGEEASFTCGQLSGEGTSAGKTATSLTVTNLVYGGGCKVAGSLAIEVRTNGCTYSFTSEGGNVTVGCSGSPIEIELLETGCIYTIGYQALSGITYHNIGTAPNREVTVSTKVSGIAVSAHGTKAQCLIEPTGLTGEYTTGNTIVTAESDDGNATMADGWWQ